MDVYGVIQEEYQRGAAASGYKTRTGAKNGTAESTKQSSSQRYGEVRGRTIGEPKLSEKAAKYYEQLKKKYSNVDFILVSPEMKEQAEQNKGSLVSAKDLIVLVDSDKIEKMAEDENYRKKYEGIISAGLTKMTQMKNNLGSAASAVRSFGMSVDDHGNASYFAVLDRSLAAQRERIAEKRKESAEAKKENAKKAAERKAEKQKEEKKYNGKESNSEDDTTVTLTAGSWDELLKKLQQYLPESTANLRTETERYVGQQFDFTI